jgi:hypothetical protein
MSEKRGRGQPKFEPTHGQRNQVQLDEGPGNTGGLGSARRSPTSGGSDDAGAGPSRPSSSALFSDGKLMSDSPHSGKELNAIAE